MTRFNPKNKSILTLGEQLFPAMEITEAEDAKQYFEEYVLFIVKHDLKDLKIKLLEMNGNIDVNLFLKQEAERIAKSNLRYFAGYYDNETIERVERLFMKY